MHKLSSPYLIPDELPVFRDLRGDARYWYGLFILAFLMAGLEFGQDYISSVLNDNPFSLADSLSYKLFWFCFPPFFMLIKQWLDYAQSTFGSRSRIIFNGLLIILVTLAHLVLFSLLLYGISSLVYHEAWSIYYLLTEKLSTRLYLGLSIYLLLSWLYLRSQKSQPEPTSPAKTPARNIPIKNGTRTTVVDVDTIGWIQSDGSYIRIHTPQKEYLKLDSLKQIITTLPDNFQRVHRSTIVNLDQIKTFQSRGNGDYDLVMDCGEVLRLSRNYAKPLRDRLL